MLPTRTDRNQTFGPAGELLSETIVDVDITVEANTATVRTRAELGLATNSTFLAVASPSNAQTVAQVKALTRQVSGLIRLQLGKLDDITGTG